MEPYERFRDENPYLAELVITQRLLNVTQTTLYFMYDVRSQRKPLSITITVTSN